MFVYARVVPRRVSHGRLDIPDFDLRERERAVGIANNICARERGRWNFFVEEVRGLVHDGRFFGFVWSVSVRVILSALVEF